jgi:hypothetical protein
LAPAFARMANFFERVEKHTAPVLLKLRAKLEEIVGSDDLTMKQKLNEIGCAINEAMPEIFKTFAN